MTFRDEIPDIFKIFDYPNRLEALQLTTLKKRMGDLIYMFKIVKGIDDIDLDFNDSKTRERQIQCKKSN